MPVESSLSADQSTLLISIKGKFDFKLLNEFRHAYSGDALSVKNLVIDMRDTSTIDSSALGMLLNMRRYLEDRDIEIKIINCNQDVLNVFRITHFNRKFLIE